MSQLNKVESKELSSIKKEFEEQLESLGLQTNHRSIAKTETGYTFRRVCKHKNCGAKVNLKINIKNEIGIIIFEEKCKQH